MTALDQTIADIVRDVVREELAAVLDQLRDHTAALATPAPRNVSLSDAAHIAGVSRSTIERRIADDTLRCVRIGSRTLVPVDALTDLTGPKKD